MLWQVLRNLVQAFKLLAEAPAAPVSAGMNLLNAHRQQASPQVTPHPTNPPLPFLYLDIVHVGLPFSSLSRLVLSNPLLIRCSAAQFPPHPPLPFQPYPSWVLPSDACSYVSMCAAWGAVLPAASVYLCEQGMICWTSLPKSICLTPQSNKTKRYSCNALAAAVQLANLVAGNMSETHGVQCCFQLSLLLLCAAQQALLFANTALYLGFRGFRVY